MIIDQEMKETSVTCQSKEKRESWLSALHAVVDTKAPSKDTSATAFQISNYGATPDQQLDTIVALDSIKGSEELPPNNDRILLKQGELQVWRRHHLGEIMVPEISDF